MLLGGACSDSELGPIKRIEITTMGELKTQGSYEKEIYYFSETGEIARGEQSFTFNNGRDGMITKRYDIIYNNGIGEDKPDVLQYDCSEGGNLIYRLSTKQKNSDLFTETFYWTQGSDGAFTTYDITYEMINDKPYLKEIIEYQPDVEGNLSKEERELTRAVFNYDEFANGKLSVEIYLLKDLIGVEQYKIRHYKNREFQLPDPLITQISPLKHQFEFMLLGKLGTWDYYVEHLSSKAEQTNYDVSYSFSKGRLKSATIKSEHQEFNYRKAVKYIEYRYR